MLTLEQIESIRSFKKNHISRIRQMFGCTHATAIMVADKLGITYKKRFQFTAADVAYWKERAKHVTSREAALEIGVHRNAVYAILGRHGITCKPIFSVKPQKPPVKFDFTNVTKKKYRLITWKNGLEVRADAFGLEIYSKR
jgi:hypothetical protein